MNDQLSHTTTPFTDEKFPIVLLCDGVQGPANVGALFRISDALGVSELIFCNAEINFNSNRLIRTSRNTVTKTPYRVSENSLSEIENLRTRNYQIVALELTNTSIPIESFDCESENKIALLIGGENHGISSEVLQEIDIAFHINMYGKNSSMNVVQATGIALHYVIQSLNK